MFALLIDPEKASDEWLRQIMSIVDGQQSIVNSQLFIFVGGSQLRESAFDVVEKIKSLTSIPVVMFPGDTSQFADNVDALLFLSLASGRNSKYLIEQHIDAAQTIKKSGVECISTGYILIDGGKHTAVERISNTSPYSTDNIQLITNTALACELLGHKIIYLEAGSGANHPVPQNIIKATRETISIPLIVGGGIKTPQQMLSAFDSGADLIVVGNHLESHPNDLSLFLNNIKSL
ncbi:MAG: geranylgeranylglyceryl/heptaprenylglyceryl phosphate synthase [Paludibacteraceae bacterium]|nr:geranylgeranylglyceryl/heptaprenylglyceryl phosphate synthase [Paludibacteraceae bacterium]